MLNPCRVMPPAAACWAIAAQTIRFYPACSRLKRRQLAEQGRLQREAALAAALAADTLDPSSALAGGAGAGAGAWQGGGCNVWFVCIHLAPLTLVSVGCGSAHLAFTLATVAEEITQPVLPHNGPGPTHPPT